MALIVVVVAAVMVVALVEAIVPRSAVEIAALHKILLRKQGSASYWVLTKALTAHMLLRRLPRYFPVPARRRPAQATSRVPLRRSFGWSGLGK